MADSILEQGIKDATAKGLLRRTREFLDKAGDALGRGSTENADTLLKKHMTILRQFTI